MRCGYQFTRATTILSLVLDAKDRLHQLNANKKKQGWSNRKALPLVRNNLNEGSLYYDTVQMLYVLHVESSACLHERGFRLIWMQGNLVPRVFHLPTRRSDRTLLLVGRRKTLETRLEPRAARENICLRTQKYITKVCLVILIGP